MKTVVIGAGAAGLSVALALAPQPVVVLSPGKLGDGSATGWAQGGIAAAVGDDDTPALHAEDTLKAANGIGDAAVTRTITDSAPGVIDWLCKLETPFDRDEAGKLRLGLEAAHGRRRIVHAADKTGAAVLQTLIAAARRTPSIEIIEGATAREIVMQQGWVAGVRIEREGRAWYLPALHVVLATGGAGALWKETSNPLGAWGSGLVLAAKVHATFANLEFMQFHPTAIDIGLDPMPLASEALRGEGCTLIDDTGERFVEELLPRDVVARAIFKRRAEGHKVFLDGRNALGPKFAARFPTVYQACIKSGIDPTTAPIPVAPAAHYHMGGVAVDAEGRSDVEGLWACGEVACTGLHGANRLASNSLIEAISCGRTLAQAISGLAADRESDRSLMTWGMLKDPANEWTTQIGKLSVQLPMTGYGERPETFANRQPDAQDIAKWRATMSRCVGVERDAEKLTAALDLFVDLVPASDMGLACAMITLAALKREESRGAHMRTDFPAAKEEWAHAQNLDSSQLSP